MFVDTLVSVFGQKITVNSGLEQVKICDLGSMWKDKSYEEVQIIGSCGEA